MNGPDPIQPSQILGWMDINGIRLMVDEVNLIIDIDASFRSILAREQELNRPKEYQNEEPQRRRR
jgi:hypothetical protein